MQNKPASHMGFREIEAALFALDYCLKEFPLSATVNHFEFRFHPKQLMLLSYKIWLCYICHTE